MKSLPKTDIEYLTHHWPVVTGCSFGCPWCWARKNAEMRPACHDGGVGVAEAPRLTEEHAAEFADGRPMPFGVPLLHPDRLDLPLRRKKPARIGVCFTGDLFGPEVPFEFELQVWSRMALSEQHTFFLLTKRAREMQESFQAWHENVTTGWPLPNVWAGVSVTTPEEYHERVWQLRDTPAANRWVSYEPCLADPGRIDLTGISWLVVGSIDRPSPQYPAPRREWIDSIVEQCRAAGVPVWVKNNAQKLNANGLKSWPQELPS